MKKLFFSLMTMLGVALSSADSEAATLADISVEAGASISNTTTHRDFSQGMTPSVVLPL